MSMEMILMMYQVDTLLDDSFVNAAVDVLSSVRLRGVDAATRIQRQQTWLKEVAGEEEGPSPSSSSSSDDSLGEAVVDHAQLVRFR